MKLLLQKVSQAKVLVDQKIIGKIDSGLVLFLAIHRNDDITTIPEWIEKIVHLKIFTNTKKVALSVKEIKGEILLVSQITLYASFQSGCAPSFSEAMPFAQAKIFYKAFRQELIKAVGSKNITTGRFGAHMQIDLINDGPVTILLP